jgi:hypothetical protein
MFWLDCVAKAKEPPEFLFESSGDEFPYLPLKIYFAFLYPFLWSRCCQ